MIDNLAYDVLPSLVEWIPLASGLIILLPGLALVDAVEELAHGHLVSARRGWPASASMLLAMTFGAVLGIVLGGGVLAASRRRWRRRACRHGGWAGHRGDCRRLDDSFSRPPARHVDCAGGFDRGAGRVADGAARSLGRVGRAVPGGVRARRGRQLFARLSRQPAELFAVPGLALLVPGSFGVRSMAALLSEQTTRRRRHGLSHGPDRHGAGHRAVGQQHVPLACERRRQISRQKAVARAVEYLDVAVTVSDAAADRRDLKQSSRQNSPGRIGPLGSATRNYL